DFGHQPFKLVTGFLVKAIVYGNGLLSTGMLDRLILEPGVIAEVSDLPVVRIARIDGTQQSLAITATRGVPEVVLGVEREAVGRLPLHAETAVQVLGLSVHIAVIVAVAATTLKGAAHGDFVSQGNIQHTVDT